MTKTNATLGLLLVTLIWGTTFTFSKLALNHLSPASLLFIRYGIATLLLFSYYLFFQKKENLYQALVKGGLLGLLNFIALRTQTVGLLYTTATNAAFITSTSVLLVPFIEWLIFKKKINITVIGGIVLGASGLYLLIMPGGWKSTINIGDILVLICALAYAFQISLIPRLSKGFSTIEITLGFLLFTTLPNTWGLEIPTWVNIVSSLGHVLYLATLATVLTIYLQIHCQRSINPVSAGFIYLLEPVFGFIFAALVLGERLAMIPLIGAIFIVSSTMLVNFEEFRKK